MIKVEKGNLVMKGHPAVLEAEITIAIKGFYHELIRDFGDEFAERRIDAILENALVPAEDEDDEDDEDDEALETLEDIKGLLAELRGILKEEMEGEM